MRLQSNSRDDAIINYIATHPNSKAVEVAKATFPNITNTVWCSVVCKRLTSCGKLVKNGVRYSVPNNVETTINDTSANIKPNIEWIGIPTLGKIDRDDMIDIQEDLLKIAKNVVDIFPESKCSMSAFLAGLINNLNRAAATISVIVE